MAPKKKVTKEKVSYDSSKSAEEQIISKCKGITYLNADNSSSVKEWIFCGSYKLARAVSKGLGLPVGRLTTIIGKKSSGKSTLVAEIIKESQKMDALVVLFDTEYTFSEERATQLGIDCSTLMVSQPDTIEDLFDALESIVEIAKSSKRLITIIWDSLASTPTRSEVAGVSGEGAAYGEHSKLVSAGLRKVMGTIAENRVLFVIINQVKVNLNAYGNGDDTTYIAKLPLEFHSSVMIDIRQNGVEKGKTDDDDPIGIYSKLKVIKNKVSAPFKEALINIKFESGIDTDWEALEIAKEEGRALLDGSWTKIIMDCPDCRVEEIDEETGEVTYDITGKVDGKKCPACEGKKWVGRPEFKFFYGTAVREMYEKHPGLKEYFLFGTGPYEMKESV
jgi:recombination protein RecA